MHNTIKAAKDVLCCDSLTADYTPATAQRPTEINLNVLVRRSDGQVGSPSDTERQRAQTPEHLPSVVPVGLSAAGPGADGTASTCQISRVSGISGRMTERPAVNQPPRIPKG